MGLYVLSKVWIQYTSLHQFSDDYLGFQYTPKVILIYMSFLLHFKTASIFNIINWVLPPGEKNFSKPIFVNKKNLLLT